MQAEASDQGVSGWAGRLQEREAEVEVEVGERRLHSCGEFLEAFVARGGDVEADLACQMGFDDGQTLEVEEVGS